MNADIGYLHRERVRAYTHRSRHTYCERQPAASQVTKQRRKRKMNGIFFLSRFWWSRQATTTPTIIQKIRRPTTKEKKQIYTEKK